MDDAITIVVCLLTGGLLLCVALLMRRCATLLLEMSADAPQPKIARGLAMAVGPLFAVLGAGSLVVELCTLVAGYGVYALSLGYLPACVSLAAALVLVLVNFVGHLATRIRAKNDGAISNPSDGVVVEAVEDRAPPWWKVPAGQFTAAAATLAILGAYLLILDINPGNSPPPAALMIPGVFSLILSLTGLLLIQSAQFFKSSAGGGTIAERERLANALRKLSILYLVLGSIAWFLPGIVLGLLLSLMAVGAVAASYRAARLASLWTMATTLRSGRTLSDELSAQASAASGRAKTLLRRAADELSEGRPLSQSLYASGVVPRGCWLQAAGGLASGKLPEALRAAAARETTRFAIRSGTDNSRYSAGYFIVLCQVAVVIVSFVMYYIIPKFKKIFEDFGTGLPNATQVLIATSDGLVNYWYLFVPGLFLATAAAVVLEVQAVAKGWPELLELYLGPYWVRLRAPDLLRGLKWAVESERPLDQVLLQMAHVPLPMAYRSRLFHAAKRVERGEELWGVLQAQGWLNAAEADLLRTAEQNRRLPWALETLSESSESAREFRFAALTECAAPVLLLGMGLIVGAIVYCLFLPLVFLTMNMA